MSGNLLRYAMDYASPDNPLTQGSPTWADAAQWHAQNAQQAWAAAQDPAMWQDAARQYGNALIMGTTAPGFRAFHGSPYDFERFDASKIGTGEGAQAYGHGLYFAENEATARAYRDAVSAKLSPTQTADYMAASSQHRQAQSDLDTLHDKMVQDSLKQGAQLDPQWGEMGVTPLPHIVDQYKPQWDEASARLTAGHEAMQKLITAPRPTGKMYEVNIGSDPAHFLDWDKPLSEQSQHVKDALQGDKIASVRQTDAGFVVDYTRNGEPVTSRPFVTEDQARNAAGPLTAAVRDWAAAHAKAQGGDYRVSAEQSKALQEAGIPGIRYLDAGSRGQGGTSKNTVVFDPATIEILRKYGIAGLMAGGGAAAATQGGQER